MNMLIDVNGKKLPNVMGRDIYLLDVYKDKVIPADWGFGGAVSETSCSKTSTGDGCATKVISGIDF